MKRSLKKLLSFVLMAILTIQFSGMAFSAESAPPTPPIIGVSNVMGKVLKVETIDNLAFLTISANNETRAFYEVLGKDIAPTFSSLTPGDIVIVEYALGTPKKYGELMAMPFSSYVLDQKAVQKPIGADTKTAVVKSFKKSGRYVFLTVTSGKETQYYYTDRKSKLAKQVLKMKKGTKINIRYVLGTPVKYGKVMATPMTGISLVK